MHNDHEIISMIQEGDESALELMVEKYRRLIIKKIYKFNLTYYFDDLFQECLIILYQSAMMFDASYNKTFTRFFEMNIERHCISTIATFKRRQEITRNYLDDIAENTHCLHERTVYYDLHLEEVRRILTPCEFSVYEGRELKNRSFESIAASLDINIKSAYNAMHRAKAKIRAYFED